MRKEFGRTVTWWLIPLSKWVITPVISGLTLLIPFITGVITHLLSGMSHQVRFRLTKFLPIFPSGPWCSTMWGGPMWSPTESRRSSRCFGIGTNPKTSLSYKNDVKAAFHQRFCWFYLVNIQKAIMAIEFIDLPTLNWLVVWNFFPYIGCNHPNWRSLHHFSEGWLNHQPDYY